MSFFFFCQRHELPLLKHRIKNIILVRNILRRQTVGEAYIKILLKSMIIKIKKCSLTLLNNKCMSWPVFTPQNPA